MCRAVAELKRCRSRGACSSFYFFFVVIIVLFFVAVSALTCPDVGPKVPPDKPSEAPPDDLPETARNAPGPFLALKPLRIDRFILGTHQESAGLPDREIWPLDTRPLGT